MKLSWTPLEVIFLFVLFISPPGHTFLPRTFAIITLHAIFIYFNWATSLSCVSLHREKPISVQKQYDKTSRARTKKQPRRKAARNCVEISGRLAGKYGKADRRRKKIQCNDNTRNSAIDRAIPVATKLCDRITRELFFHIENRSHYRVDERQMRRCKCVIVTDKKSSISSFAFGNERIEISDTSFPSFSVDKYTESEFQVFDIWKSQGKKHCTTCMLQWK